MVGRLLIPARARVRRAQVRRVEWITATIVRVILGGADIAALDLTAYTDHYVKLVFPHPDAGGTDLVDDIAAMRKGLPRQHWPRIRTYTVRAWDPVAAEVAIDFVQHGDQGVAAPWAARARPGERVLFLGPGGGYAPDPAAGWHLMIGDETALPAIAVALERLPATARATVLLEVADATEEQDLISAANTTLRWLHRDSSGRGEGLVAAVRELSFPAGAPDAFVHGEADTVKRLRRHLRLDRGIAREHLSISGYWRHGSDEDRWQAAKAGWNRRLDEEESASAAPSSTT